MTSDGYITTMEAPICLYSSTMWTVNVGVGLLALVHHLTALRASPVLVKRETSDGTYQPVVVAPVSRQYGLPRWTDSEIRENAVPKLQNSYGLPVGPEVRIRPVQGQVVSPVYVRTSEVQPQLVRVAAVGIPAVRVPSSRYGVPAARVPATQYGPPALRAPSTQYGVPQERATYSSVAPQPASGPSLQSIPSQPYAPAQVEGGRLSPEELEAPTTPQPQRSNPIPQPTLSGGDLSPEELEIPRNTQIKLQDKDLQYSHGFSDDKGTTFKEQGKLLSTNDGWEYVIAKTGSYSYVSPEGIPIEVKYIADHNGFRILP